MMDARSVVMVQPSYALFKSQTEKNLEFEMNIVRCGLKGVFFFFFFFLKITITASFSFNIDGYRCFNWTQCLERVFVLLG